MAVWLGDILRCLTGDFLKGTVHRVKMDKDCITDRYSMPFFIRARNNVPIQSLVEVPTESQHTQERFENYKVYFDKKFRTTQCTANFNYIPPF